MITFVTHDGFTARCDKEFALQHFGLVKFILEECDAEIIPLPGIPKVSALEHVIECMKAEDREKYLMDRHDVLDITAAANYLQAQSVLESAVRVVANMAVGKVTVNQMAATFGIVNEEGPWDENDLADVIHIMEEEGNEPQTKRIKSL